MLWFPSANRDESIVLDADSVDVGRTPNDRLACYMSEHFRLGAGFARLELRVLFEALLCGFPEIASAGPPEPLRPA